MPARSHVFVVRDGEILVLGGGGARWWELPGGDLEDGEDGRDAAIRETFEETGLSIEAPELLRAWGYHNRRGEAVACYAYAVDAPAGDIRLSTEHSAYAWMSVDEYAEWYCDERIAEAAPQYVEFFREMRTNCGLFREWLHVRDGRGGQV